MARKVFGNLAIIVMIMAACLMQSCTSKDFKVNVELKGLGSQNVRVVYQSADGGIVDSWLTAQNDALVITGDCASPSLLILYNSMNVPIMRLVVSGGDNLEVKGSVTAAYELEIKGSEIMEQWNEFVVKHKNEYSMNNSPKLNAAIEEYVKNNPKSLVSTLLVLIDYAPADGNKVAQLLKSIDESAKPKNLMESYNVVAMRAKNAVTTLTALNLLEMESDDFKVARFTGPKTTVICFWDKDMDDEKRRATFEDLRMIDTTRVNIIDINIDSDSVQWRRIIAETETKWKHYWAPGSMMNSELMKLQITSTPTIIVTDSLGRQQYRGSDTNIVRQTVES